MNGVNSINRVPIYHNTWILDNNVRLMSLLAFDSMAGLGNIGHLEDKSLFSRKSDIDTILVLPVIKFVWIHIYVAK